VLCSRDASAREAWLEAARELPPERIVAVDLPEGWSLPGLTLKADRSPLFRERTCDTATKRNLGLVLARQVGWRSVLFLDDDVRGVRERHLRMLGRLLASPGGPPAMGWAFDDFPDNSMVCHAYRLAGGPQDTFVGGGALAVRTNIDVPFFPKAYNEDWLFMLPLLANRSRGVALAGTLAQTPFDPFAHHADAVRQEAGDVLAEGLFRLLHRDRSAGALLPARKEKYWRSVLAKRQELIALTKTALVLKGETARPESEMARMIERACAALDDALAADHTKQDRARLLSEWVETWESDRRRWRRYLEGITAQSTVPATLSSLGLEESLVTGDTGLAARSTGKMTSTLSAWMPRVPRLHSVLSAGVHIADHLRADARTRLARTRGPVPTPEQLAPLSVPGVSRSAPGQTDCVAASTDVGM
jgi:hypothetical protein